MYNIIQLNDKDLSELQLIPNSLAIDCNSDKSLSLDVYKRQTELCPAHIYIIVHYRVHEVGQCVESGDIMTPEGEAGKPEMQAAFQ